ncbi:MAG TPA: DMT family transporter [Anaeromyxobacteraceae bacterium]|nr:DMT family transporter [Anaeromyxobacteraceae bacterium]
MTSVTRARAIGPVLKVLSAAALWGISGVVARSLFQRAVDPAHLVQIRMLVGGAALLPLLAWRGSLAVPRRLWPALGGYAALMALLQLSYFEAIAEAGVAVAVFLQYTAPLLVAAWESLRARSLPPRPVSAALLLAVAGSAMLVLPGGSLRVPLAGLAWGLASAFAMAAATVVSGALRHRGMGALPLVAWGFLLGSLAFTARRTPWTALATVPDWPYFLYVAVFATAVPFALYVSALGALAGTVTMLLAMLEPALAAALAWLFLGEALSAGQVAGGLLILGGVALAAASARR